MLKLNSLVILLSLAPIQACYSMDEDLFRAALVSDAVNHLGSYNKSTHWEPEEIYRPGDFLSEGDRNSYYEREFPESWAEEFYFTLLTQHHEVYRIPRNMEEILGWFGESVVEDCTTLKPGDLYAFRVELDQDAFSKSEFGIVIHNDSEKAQITAIFGSMPSFKSNGKRTGINVHTNSIADCFRGGNIYQAIQ